jgi:hypothetical protein
VITTKHRTLPSGPTEPPASQGAPCSEELNSTTVGSNYGQLASSKGVSLGGTLSVTRLKGFLPTIGEIFTIITGSAVSGQFATVKGLSINASEHFEINYGGTGVTLQVVSGP